MKIVNAIKKISSELEIVPDAITVHCEPFLDKKGKMQHEVDIVYNNMVYQAFYFEVTDNLLRELLKVNFAFPQVEIHV